MQASTPSQQHLTRQRIAVQVLSSNTKGQHDRSHVTGFSWLAINTLGLRSCRTCGSCNRNRCMRVCTWHKAFIHVSAGSNRHFSCGPSMRISAGRCSVDSSIRFVRGALGGGSSANSRLSSSVAGVANCGGCKAGGSASSMPCACLWCAAASTTWALQPFGRVQRRLHAMHAVLHACSGQDWCLTSCW